MTLFLSAFQIIYQVPRSQQYAHFLHGGWVPDQHCPHITLGGCVHDLRLPSQQAQGWTSSATHLMHRAINSHSHSAIKNMWEKQVQMTIPMYRW